MILSCLQYCNFFYVVLCSKSPLEKLSSNKRIKPKNMSNSSCNGIFKTERANLPKICLIASNKSSSSPIFALIATCSSAITNYLSSPISHMGRVFVMNLNGFSGYFPSVRFSASLPISEKTKAVYLLYLKIHSVRMARNKKYENITRIMDRIETPTSQQLYLHCARTCAHDVLDVLTSIVLFIA